MPLTREDLEGMRDKNDIQDLISALADSDPYLRITAVNFLSEAGGSKVSKPIIETLWKEPDSYVRQVIVSAFISNKMMIEDPYTIKLLLEYLSNSGGEIFDAFSEILSNMENQLIICDGFRKLRPRCPIIQERCNKTFNEFDDFFVAHPFTRDRIDDLRRAINTAVREIFPSLSPYYADQEVRGDIYCKICLKIQAARFGIYDISEACSNCHKSNSNVTLELGLAFGLNKRTILIARKGSQIINDLQRFDRIEYESYVGLERELKSKLSMYSF